MKAFQEDVLVAKGKGVYNFTGAWFSACVQRYVSVILTADMCV